MSKVDELMKIAFLQSRRTWRSHEYRDGARAVLEFRFAGATRVPELPDSPGSAAADAYLAGMEEGWALLSRFEPGSAQQVSGAECQLWIEEQRARVMENMSYGLGSRLTRDAAHARSLIVIQAISHRLPSRAPRYPWEYESGGAKEETSGGASEHGSGSNDTSGSEPQ